MKGDIYTWQKCRCGGEWEHIINPVTKRTINIVCRSCHGAPELWGVDARSFKNRRGSVGRITRDRNDDPIYSPHHAMRILESISADWDALGRERFDPAKHSRQGRKVHKLSECAGEWRTNLQERGVKDATIAHVELNFRLHILPILGDMDIRELTEDDIERLQRELRKKEGIGENSVKGCLQNLRTLLKRYHERKHVLSRLPAFPEGWSASVFVERHEVTVPEQRHLMAQLVMTYPKRVRKTMLLLQKTYVAMGCRPGEAHGLRREDILEDGRVKIQGAVDPVTGEYGPRKTKDSRTTPDPLPDDLLMELRALPVIGRGHLFTDENGKLWNQNRVSNRFKKLCDIPGVTYYVYSKHSMATRVARGKAEKRIVDAANKVGVTTKIAKQHYILGR